ncbi:MAG: ABC transporter permease [Treponemataceae bacterium]|nr:ABC transporter permease [Treponemataceae bacterium]
MNFLLETLILASPLLLVAVGSLFSEHCGILAIFTEGILNLAAFIFFAFSVLTGSIIASIPMTISVCLILIFLLALLNEKTDTNPFLLCLAFNLLSQGLIEILSKKFFHTQGVLVDSGLFGVETQFYGRLWGSIIAYLLSLAALFFLKFSKTGISFRAAGLKPELLDREKNMSSRYRIASWLLATFFSCIASIILVLRISSFVPNISGGRGWLALAAVLAGRKNVSGIFIAVFLFTLFEEVAVHFQGSFSFIPPTLTLALPYILALLAFFLVPKKKN